MYRLNQLGKYADNLANNFTWANTYGLGRALLAMSLLVTLCFNDLQALVAPMGATETGAGDKVLLPMAKIGLYQLFPEYLSLIKAFSIVVLLAVISGWRPRITGFFHWWVTFSYTTSAMVVDGGDQIAQIVTLLLIPLCLADNRKWHWTTVSANKEKELSFYQRSANLIALTTLFIIQLQVAFIYFHAGVGKLAVEEWVNGTSIFYWIQNPTFGACDTLRPALIALFSNPYVVTFTTWGVLLLEVLLFMAIGLNDKWKSGLLKTGILFHFGIIIMHGLVSFFFVMAGILFLYLGPREGIDFSKWFNWFKPKQKNITPKHKEIPGPSPAISIRA